MTGLSPVERKGIATQHQSTMIKPKKTYFYSKIYFLTISTLLILAVSLVGIFWVRSEYLHNEETLQANYEDTVSERKTKVKTQINELI